MVPAPSLKIDVRGSKHPLPAVVAAPCFRGFLRICMLKIKGKRNYDKEVHVPSYHIFLTHGSFALSSCSSPFYIGQCSKRTQKASPCCWGNRPKLMRSTLVSTDSGGFTHQRLVTPNLAMAEQLATAQMMSAIIG